MDRKGDVFQFDDVRVDVGNAQILKSGRLLTVEPKAFRVLVYLLENRGRLVEKEDLLKAIWPKTFVTENALTREIALVRKALGDSATDARYIETVPTRGYRFIAPIATDAPEGGGGTHSGSVLSRRRGKTLVLAIIAAGVVFTVVGLWIYRVLTDQGTLRPEKMQVTRVTDSGKADNMTISADGRFVAYVFRAAEKQSLRMHQVAAGSDVEILGPDDIDFGLPGLTFSPDGNYLYFVRSDKNAMSFKSLYRIPAFGGPVHKLMSNVDSAVSFSPDGLQFVYTRANSNRGAIEMRIASADGTGDRLLTEFSGVDMGFQDGTAWSPNGRTIAITIRQSGKPRWVINAVSVADGSVHELYSHALGAIGRPSWLPDGKTLLASLGIPVPAQKRVEQIWAFSYPKGEARRFTNDLTNYDFFVSVARHANIVAALKDTLISNIWVGPLGDWSSMRQITFGEPPMLEAIDAGGQVVARSSRGELWKVKPNGQPELFAEVTNAYELSACGRFVVFNSDQPGGIQLIRADADGSNITRLATVDSWTAPVCSPDGKFLFYMTLGPPMTIWRMPIEGGIESKVATVLGKSRAGNICVSPDGKLLAYLYEETDPKPVARFEVLEIEGGRPIRLLPGPVGRPIGLHRDVTWSPDGKSLHYLATRDDVTNIWAQPLAGGEPHQLTNFTSGEIQRFSWTSDNKLLVARWEFDTDVVLLSNFR
jgi:DNA-binding winged helix-turn-helix (wHTH) protein/Tol biopolymer transport system component